jgi:hypothetical protein
MSRDSDTERLTPEKFIDLATQECEFLLKDFGFVVWQATAEDTGVEVILHRPPTALKIGLEWRDRYLYVEFFESAGEQTPPNVLRQRHRFSLDDLLSLRAPQASVPPPGFDEALSVTRVRDQLAAYARRMREYAVDLLHGDWTVFPQLEALMQDREHRWREQQTK